MVPEIHQNASQNFSKWYKIFPIILNFHWIIFFYNLLSTSSQIFFKIMWIQDCKHRHLHLSSVSSPRFNISQLMLATILSALVAVCLACSVKVSFSSNHSPTCFRGVQSYFVPFLAEEWETELMKAHEQHCFHLHTTARLSPGDLIP